LKKLLEYFLSRKINSTEHVTNWMKFDEFTEDIPRSKAEVIFVIETWWTDMSNTNIPGYSLLSEKIDVLLEMVVYVFMFKKISSHMKYTKKI
jgi:hypothetical protein